MRALTALLTVIIAASLVAAAAQPAYDDVYLEKARSFIASESTLLAELFDTVTNTATTIMVSEENGVITVEWVVEEGYEASARFVMIGGEPTTVSLEILLPSEVMAQLGIGKDTLVEEAERAINAAVSSLPEWVGIKEQRLPDDGVDISLTALSNFTIAVLDTDNASIERIFKIFYLIGRIRYGYSVVLGDESALLMAYLGGSVNPHITQPKLSTAEAREKAIEALTNVSKGKPRILIDGAYAVITPNKDIVAMYVIVANVMSGGDYEATRYMVLVNMEDGSVTIKSKKVYALGGAGQQEAPDPQSVIEDNTLATTTQAAGDQLTPQESWITGSALPITFVAVFAAAVIIVSVSTRRH